MHVFILKIILRLEIKRFDMIGLIANEQLSTKREGWEHFRA